MAKGEHNFRLVGRDNVGGGTKLRFRHGNCEHESSVFIPEHDELRDNYPLKCPCGREINMYFGNPKFGKKLMSLLKLPVPEDRFRGAEGPSNN